MLLQISHESLQLGTLLADDILVKPSWTINVVGHHRIGLFVDFGQS